MLYLVLSHNHGMKRLWANSFSVRIEVNVTDARAGISLEVTDTRVARRAARMPQSRTYRDRAAP